MDPQGWTHRGNHEHCRRADSVLVWGLQVGDKTVKTCIPATEPPDPRRVSEGSLKGSLKASLKGFRKVFEGVS